MPIISIKTLPLDAGVDTSAILCKITVGTAKIMGCPPEHVWATWEFLQPDNYAVGNTLSKNQPASSHSPIVRILSFEGKSQATIENMMKTMAGVLSEGLAIRLENIFIEYSEGYSGKIFDGGQMVYAKTDQTGKS